MAITIDKPTVGGSDDSWGTTINEGLTAIQSTFNGSGTGKATVSPDISTLTLNGVDVTADAGELNKLTDCTSSTAELNKLTGLNASTAEMNHLVGVTSAIQTQINAKAPSASPSFTGTISLPQNWTITISGTGASSKFVLSYDGTAMMSLSATGALVLEDNVTAFGTP